MKLAPEELAIISGLVQRYKEMPQEKRPAIKAEACRLSVWQGTDVHTRALNKALHERLCQADAELRAARPSEKPEFTPPTMQETIAAARATVAWIAPVVIPVAGVAVAGYIAFQAAMGIGAAVCAFFTSWGGVLVGLGLVLAFASALVGGGKEEVVEVETREEKRTVIINVNVDGEQNVKVG